MKREEVIEFGKAEYERILSASPPERIPSFWEPVLQKFLAPGRRFWWRLRSLFWRMQYCLKRHFHLYLMLRHEEKHWKVELIFRAQARREREPKKIEGLFDSLARRLAPLRREMESVAPATNVELRKFRGKFAKIVREQRGLSRAQVCRLLNSHKDLSVLARPHPSYWHEFPFTPTFIEKFEEETANIFDEITQGFLFGAGFPTEAFVKWLSEIYCAEEEFAQFKEWYATLALKQIENW